MRFIPFHPLTLALLGGQAAVLVASFLPIWTLWYFNPREGLGYGASLWSVLWHTVIEPPRINPEFQVTTSGDMLDLWTGGVIFVVGAALGLLIYFFVKRSRRL